MNDKERLDYLIRYLDVLAKLPHDGPRTDEAYKVRKKIRELLGIDS